LRGIAPGLAIDFDAKAMLLDQNTIDAGPQPIAPRRARWKFGIACACLCVANRSVIRRSAATASARKRLRERIMTNLIGWILFGLIAGNLARFLHPGFDRMGIGATILLGILGSVVGGAIAYTLHLGTEPYQPGGWIMSILGAFLLLSLGFFSTQSRALR
jgi:uncharacterized membrane protein YeaQ/YmgE (transglycosylase-associated protein family)